MPVATLVPFSDADRLDGWTSTGAELHTELDESPHDGDATYIQGTNGIQRVVLQRFGLPDSALINSVTFTGVGRRFAPGQNVDTFRLVLSVEIGRTMYTLANPEVFDFLYTTVSAVMTTSPATGLAWSVQEVSLLICGLSSVQTFGDVPATPSQNRWTQLFATVDYVEPTFTLIGAGSEGFTGG